WQATIAEATCPPSSALALRISTFEPRSGKCSTGMRASVAFRPPPTTSPIGIVVIVVASLLLRLSGLRPSLCVCSGRLLRRAPWRAARAHAFRPSDLLFMRPGVTVASVKPRRPPQPLSAHEQKKKGYADQDRRGSPTKRQFGHPRDPGEREQDGRGYRHQQPIERAASRLCRPFGVSPLAGA